MRVLKFYADWCGPCKGLSMVIKGAGDKITVPIDEINIDNELMMSVEYGVRSVPTMILVDENSTELKRHVGTLNEEQLLTFLKV
jgi:thioredoxin 1